MRKKRIDALRNLFWNSAEQNRAQKHPNLWTKESLEETELLESPLGKLSGQHRARTQAG